MNQPALMKIAAGGLVLSVATVGDVAWADMTYRPVLWASSDTNAAGTANFFDQPAINNAGRMAVSVRLNGPFVTGRTDNEALVVVEPDGQWEVIAREGEDDVWDGSASYWNQMFGYPAINDAGDVLYRAKLGLLQRDGKVVVDPAVGLPRTVVETGGPVPPPVTGRSLYSVDATPLLNGLGQSAAYVDYRIGASANSDVRGGLAVETAAGVSLLVEPTVTRLNPNENDVFTSASTVSGFNSAGDVLFAGYVGQPDDTDLIDRGLYAYDASDASFRRLAEVGTPAPGTPDFGFESISRRGGLNESGTVAFSARLKSFTIESGPEAWSYGLFAGTSVAPGLIARADDPVWLGDETAALTSFQEPTINDRGQVAVVAGISGSREALLRAGANGVEVLAWEGQLVPEAGPDVTIDRFIDAPVINERGQVAFSTHLMFDGVDSSQDDALFVTDPAGQPRLVVREGQVIDVDPDPSVEDLATVTWFQVANLAHQPYSLNDLGQLAISLSFENGRAGLFVVSTLPDLLGDYNASGLIEQGDLNLVLSNWGQAFDALPTAWVNGRPTEGIVDQAELNAVLNNWGASSVPEFSGATVPEPGLAVWGVLGAAGVARRRRGG